MTEGPVPRARFEIPEGDSYVGRQRGLDVELDSGLVSRVHARLRNEHGRVTVEDLRSTNGTWIGPTRVTVEAELRPGDNVRFADVSLLYAPIAAEEDIRARRRARRPSRRRALHADPDEPTVELEDRVRPAPDRHTNWWVDLTTRAKAAILTMGALAAAVSAILAFLPDRDPEDFASVTSVDVLATGVPLSRYEGSSAVLTPANAASVNRPQGIDLVAALPAGAGETAGPAEETDTTVAPSPTESGSGSLLPSPSTDLAPTSTTSPTSTSPTSAPPTEGTVEVSPEGPAVLGLVDEMAPLVEEMAPDYALSIDVDPGTPGYEPQQAPALAFLVAAVTDEEGNPVDKQVAARKVVSLLRQVRTRTMVTANGEAKKDPVGALVEVGLELSGLRDQPVSLRWQIFRLHGAAPVFGDWLDQVHAYELTASTQHDTASVPDLWVPMPKRPGRYVLRVLLARGDSVLAAGKDRFVLTRRP